MRTQPLGAKETYRRMFYRPMTASKALLDLLDGKPRPGLAGRYRMGAARYTLPYGVMELTPSSGKGIVVGRDYKPVGVPTDVWVDYELPVFASWFIPLPPPMPGRKNNDVFFFNDGTAPWLGPKYAKAYDHHMRDVFPGWRAWCDARADEGHKLVVSGEPLATVKLVTEAT